MFPTTTYPTTAAARVKAAQQFEISSEDIMLSLADENSRIAPISDNPVFFAPLDESKTKGITMEQLRASSDLTDRDGNLSNGINAYQLIGNVAKMANELQSEVTITDLFVADNKNRAQGNGIAINKQLTEAYQRRTKTDNIPFAATTFNRVFCNLTLYGQATDTHVANIVVATNQRGLQVAIGANCKACRNQTILGHSNLVSSYGMGDRSQMDVAQFLEAVRNMIAGYSFRRDIEILERMKRIPVDSLELFRIIGELTAIRVAFDSSLKLVHNMADGPCYPLSQTQINRFTESLLLTYATRKSISVYDVYQSATAIYKVASMDLPNLLPQNQAFVQFINERYALDIQ